MVRDPLTIITIDAPDRDWRAHHVLGYVARQTLVLRRHFALLDVGHQTIGVFPEAHIYQPLDRVGLKRLTQRAPHVPLPLAAQQLIG